MTFTKVMTLGIAAAIALVDDRNLADISNLEVQSILRRTGRLSKIYGTRNSVAAAGLDNEEHQMTA